MQSSRKSIQFIALVLMAACMGSALAAAVPQYRVEEIGGSGMRGFGLNNRGDVVGYKYFEGERSSPILWRRGEVTKLPGFGGPSGPGSLSGTAYAINDRGDIVGGYDHGAFLYRNGRLINLTESLGTSVGQAVGINDAGHIVGNAGGRTNAFFHDGQQGRYLFGPEVPRYYANGIGINDRDVIVGNIVETAGLNAKAYVYSQGRHELLPTLGGDYGAAIAINNAGQIVGASTSQAGEQQPFLYENGTIRNLAASPTAWGTALDINEKGWIVGQTYFDPATGESQSGFLYLNHRSYNLDTLISPLDRQRWHIDEASDINDRGQILVTASRQQDATNTIYTLLLTPAVPEAQTWILMLAGLGGLGFVLRRRSRQSSACWDRSITATS